MKARLLIIMKYVAVCLCTLPTISVYAQQDTIPQIHSTSSPLGGGRVASLTFGAGQNNVLDTYLSPYNYTGWDVRLKYETLRQTKQLNGHIYYQSLLDVNGGYLTNKTKSAHEYVAGARYSCAWMYNLLSLSSPSSPSSSLPLGGVGGGSLNPHPSSLNLFAGLQPSIYLGGIYNTRNGNNPAQAKANLMLNATAMVTYNLHIFKKVLPLRYQLTVPLLGLAYSPNYGQSYYEEFMLNQYDHNICFGNIANMPSMRHLITIDIPLRKRFLRIGWSGEFNQSKLNNLRYHSYSNCLMLGYSLYR